ncbi:MAG: protein kinase [Bradymonadaceae bacterium]
MTHSIRPTVRVAHYTLLDRLDRGDRVQTYLAQDPMGENVVFKFCEGLRLGPRFRNETFLKIDTPATTRILDEGCFEGRPYIVREYIDGVSLEHFMHQRAAPDRRRRLLSAFAALLAAVDDLHKWSCPSTDARGIAHRALHERNILLTPQGTIKLINFEFVKPIRHQGTAQICCPMPRDAVDIIALQDLLSRLLLGHGEVPAPLFGGFRGLLELARGRVFSIGEFCERFDHAVRV